MIYYKCTTGTLLVEDYIKAALDWLLLEILSTYIKNHMDIKVQSKIQVNRTTLVIIQGQNTFDPTKLKKNTIA